MTFYLISDTHNKTDTIPLSKRFACNLCKRWTFLVFPKTSLISVMSRMDRPLVACVASNVDSSILVLRRYLEMGRSADMFESKKYPVQRWLAFATDAWRSRWLSWKRSKLIEKSIPRCDGLEFPREVSAHHPILHIYSE
ncbi:hypothetical protein HW555_005304 [Spodoptera exigua]|uniref:Uncharacterized protein n=1 Tax=Spodoptera exigua TaxID=7107 RepID=A0A835LB90_SPOEX|nr:hypothetical protein HW555_005304 [Spodoptera exigua]